MSQKKKKGTKEIEEAELIPIKNKYPDRDYRIDIELPEFTCLCPVTGYPDFAVINVHYIPDKYVVELKSLKLYINKFRNQGMYHEATVNKIMDDIVEKIDPRWIKVVGDFNRRGNVKTIVTAEHTQKNYQKEE
ncbi:MAG: preQ(1) synthase [Candidatus Marinimicrobia bacterium]|nr:preQ(1) synthase [Candidatus Neomarinimicrobiota bacterium]